MVGINDRGFVIGQDHHRSKLTDHDVWLILELRDEGLSYRQLVEKFETPKSTIRDICKGRCRGHSISGQKSLPAQAARRRPRPAHPDEFDNLGTSS